MACDNLSWNISDLEGRVKRFKCSKKSGTCSRQKSDALSMLRKAKTELKYSCGGAGSYALNAANSFLAMHLNKSR